MFRQIVKELPLWQILSLFICVHCVDLMLPLIEAPWGAREATRLRSGQRASGDTRLTDSQGQTGWGSCRFHRPRQQAGEKKKQDCGNHKESEGRPGESQTAKAMSGLKKRGEPRPSQMETGKRLDKGGQSEEQLWFRWKKVKNIWLNICFWFP